MLIPKSWTEQLRLLRERGPVIESMPDGMQVICRDLARAVREDRAAFVRDLAEELLITNVDLVLRAGLDLAWERNRYDREAMGDDRRALPTRLAECADELDRRVQSFVKTAEAVAKLRDALVPDDPD
jgi:hypothetical protein